MASGFIQILLLVLGLAVAAGAAWVLYTVYQSIMGEASDRLNAKFAKKNVVFTKDGMKVGVRHVGQEKYVDRTQNWVVKAWNMGAASPANAATGDAAKKRK